VALTPTPQLIFEVSTPERQPYRVTLTKAQNIVGRESGDIVLGDPESSAVHAEIDTTTGHVIVRDLGSSNGTWRDGKRLPQFALFEGQAFYCGNTELRLVKIDGAHDEVRPGQTAVGRTKVQSDAPPNDTLVGSPNSGPIAPPPGWSPPSPVSLGQPAPVAETTQVAPKVKESNPTLSGPHAPSSSPTAPGTQTGSSSTVPAPTEPPTHEPTVIKAVSRPTIPGPAGTTSATPSSRTLPAGDTDVPVDAPVETTDGGIHNTVDGSVQETVSDAPAAPSPTPEAPPTEPEPAADVRVDGARGGKKEVFRPPVANAVIKPGGEARASKDASPRPSAPRPRRRWGRLLGITGLSALGVGAVVGLAYLVYSLFAGRSLAFAETVATEFPSTTIGFVAIESVDETVALLANESADAQWKQLRTDAMGFDPFDPAAWDAQGVDASAPVGIALLDAKAPTFAVSLGVSDRDKFLTAVKEQLPRLLGSSPDEGLWSERTFGEFDGHWYDERGVAVLHRDERSILVFAPRPGWNDDVEDHAKALGGLRDDDSLAKTEAYAALVPPTGDTIALGYVDGAALRNALPAGASALAARLALADLDGLAIALSHERDAIHLTYEVMVREGSRHLEVLDDAKRDGKALSKLAGPVLAAYDVQLNGPALDRALGGAATALGESLSVIEKGVSDELGVGLRADVTQNLSGAFGAALLALPPDRDRKQELEAALWVGVLDDDKATKTLERVYEKGFTEFDGVAVSQRQVGDVQVYTVPGDPDRERPDFQLFVHDGLLWLLIGPVDASSIIEGPGSPFLGDVRHPSIAKAMGKGDHAAAFADIRQFIASLRPLLRSRDVEELDQMQPLLDVFETATMRTERKGRTIVMRNSVHTKDDVGLKGVLAAATALVGETMSAELARASRASRCAALSKHILELSRKSLEEKGAPLEVAWEIERTVQEHCDDPQVTTTARLDCYLGTESFQGLAACDAKHPAPGHKGDPKPDMPDEPAEFAGAEPKVVPYVDDLWPHRVDDPDSDSPQPDVNYAVTLGDSPEIRGRKDALVTIVMFGDFECQHCRAVIGAVDEVLSQHGDDVRLVFRHLPLENVHTWARPAAKAALAATEQDKFWAMHDALFERGNRLDADTIESAAREAGLDMVQYATDLASAEVDRRLQRDIDAAAKFGIRGTPAFFVNGRYLGGRQSASAFNAVINEELERAKKFVQRRGNTRKRLYEDMLSHFAPEVVQPETAIALPSLDAKRYTVSTDGLPRKGTNAFAQVEIIECGDFDCPFCARSRKVLEETLDKFPSVSLFFAHNPLDYHPGAEAAARAAQAAKAQGKFWEMHDELFKDQRSKARTDEDYKRYAARLGLDVKKFEEDYASDKTAKAVADQQTLCSENDASVTPTFFVNGRRVTGAQTAEQLEALVEAELSEGI
jgi:protein-disulfide isomerase